MFERWLQQPSLIGAAQPKTRRFVAFVVAKSPHAIVTRGTRRVTIGVFDRASI
jgi:hypothetical protein